MIPGALLIALTIYTQPLPQQHKWAPLVFTSSERIEIDTASIQTLGPNVRRVWLRWNMDAAADVTFGPPAYQPQYELELRDFECVTNRTRTIEKRREGRAEIIPLGPVQGPGVGVGESISTTEASWHEPASGSLLAQVIDAACRLTKPGA